MASYKPPAVHIMRASAGSGKTFALAAEYVSLALNNAGAYRSILGITFTNKAARELKDRVMDYLILLERDPTQERLRPLVELLKARTGMDDEQLAGRATEVLDAILQDFGNFHIYTIDSFFNRIVASFARELGLPPDYELAVDEGPLRYIAREQAFDDLQFYPEIQEGLRSFLEADIREKTRFDYYKILEKEPDRPEQIRARELLDKLIKEKLGALKYQRKILFLSDIKYITKVLLENYEAPILFEKTGMRFFRILFDELQDTSDEQWEQFFPFVLEVLSRGGSLFIVGDEKQSIYSFRGGNPALLASKAGAMCAQVAEHIFESRPENNYRSTERLVAAFNSTLENFILRAPAIAEASGFDDPDALTRLFQTIYIARQKSVRPGGSITEITVADKHGMQAALIEQLQAAPDLKTAVLTRTRDQQADVAALLDAHQIPCATDQNRPLKDFFTATDVLKFACEMIYFKLYGELVPGDRHKLKDFTPADIALLNAFYDDRYLHVPSDYVDAWYAGIRNTPIDTGQNDANVVVLTVHAAKGLEFDRVILPYDWAIIPRQDAKNERTADKIAESFNMLYVAITRAVQDLVVIRTRGRNSGPQYVFHYLDLAGAERIVA